MAVNYATSLKTTRMTAVVTALGSGALLKIGTAAMAAVLASITLGATAGTVSGAVLTISGVPLTAIAGATGTAAAATLTTSGGTVIVSGLTVGLAGSGADIIIDDISITSGQTVQLTAGTITHG